MKMIQTHFTTQIIKLIVLPNTFAAVAKDYEQNQLYLGMK